MVIKEERKNLFEVPQGYYIAACITGDYSLGAGVAKQLDEHYNMKEKLHHFFPIPSGERAWYVGNALLIDNVFNLVDKETRQDKVQEDNLYNALIDMYVQIDEKKVHKLAIPRLGCGCDGLEWEDVLEMIEEVFDDVDIEILVCVLQGGD